jgi:hypothetical protein
MMTVVVSAQHLQEAVFPLTDMVEPGCWGKRLVFSDERLAPAESRCSKHVEKSTISGVCGGRWANIGPQSGN